MIKMTGLNRPPSDYKKADLYEPNKTEEAALRELMQSASKSSGRPHTHIREIVLLISGPNAVDQAWHMDALRQFLGLVYNASLHPIRATQFVGGQSADFSMGVEGKTPPCKKARRELDSLWHAAESQQEVASAGELAPGDAIHQSAPPAPSTADANREDHGVWPR